MSHSENYQDTGHTTAFYQGRDAERERITELLENFDDSNLWRQTGPDTYEGFDVAEIIDLIKGEQK